MPCCVAEFFDILTAFSTSDGNFICSIIKKAKTMMEKDKRIRINKVMVGWSNGKEVHLPPSVRCEVDNYGKLMCDYHRSIDEGYLIDVGPCTKACEECRCREYEADHYWEQGLHIDALKEMMRAATYVLPDDEPEFEDVQWLDPWETLYWSQNIKEYLRLIRRCREYCKRDPRLWPILEESRVYRDYLSYLKALGQWARE